MNQFSIPMPYTKEQIDIVCEINKKIEKSQITSFYFALPVDCEDVTGFEQSRTMFTNSISTKYWEDTILYAKNKGFDFIYLLNSPQPLRVNSSSFQLQLKRLDNLILRLNNIGCKKYRVANTQLLGYLIKHYPNIEVLGSTSFEYGNIKQYQNFFSHFPEIKQIVPCWNDNKNFKLLKNIRKQYPNIDIEIMVNEGCLSGCSIRHDHHMDSTDFSIYNIDFSPEYFTQKCNKLFRKDEILYIFLSNIVYSWEIKEYNRIGITNFKLVGRNSPDFYKGDYLIYYEYYLKGIDNYKAIMNMPLKFFNHYIMPSNFSYKIKDIKPYLPNIKHFVEHGHLCSSKCGIECRYCYNCAEKFKRIINLRGI